MHQQPQPQTQLDIDMDDLLPDPVKEPPVVQIDSPPNEHVD